jgi:hypothetical protein
MVGASMRRRGASAKIAAPVTERAYPPEKESDVDF